MSTVYSKATSEFSIDEFKSIVLSDALINEYRAKSYYNLTFELGLNVFKVCLGLNFPVYLISQLFQKKYDWESFETTIRDTIRSSLYFYVNGVSALLYLKWLYHLIPNTRLGFRVYLASIIASFTGILVEHPSKRPAFLAIVMKGGVESLIRMANAKKFLKPFRHGETIVFTFSMAFLLYLFRKSGYGKDPVSAVIKYLMGSEEVKISSHVQHNFQQRNNNIPPLTLFGEKLPDWFRASQVTNNNCVGKHELCPHYNYSCFQYVSMGFIRPFFIGWLAKSIAVTLSKPKSFLERPIWNAFTNLFKFSNTNFGLFLGSFLSIFRGVNCMLRRTNKKDSDYHVLLAAMIAGPTMVFSPSPNLALTLAYKCVETVYCKVAHSGYNLHVRETVIAGYSITAAFLIYILMYEPEFMKPSYVRLVDRMANGKVSLVRLHVVRCCNQQFLSKFLFLNLILFYLIKQNLP